ncbi:restriction endonuclease [Stenotrophomonas sp. SORGH_AS_0321]|uniref:restriction endonuclease n=1 Tax=Stenotrophomonas sp. SORGH_AS_0321 TaxID=3041787 RepID=UPI002854E707|nr:restriction endonuclease [Stenotrophomonas sp. SORGH_AS_0321]MDR6094428.1 restriction system protein [Stenotrophomonas sp. SORGH_AS_0321]
MARRGNKSGFEVLAELPWPVGIVAGVVGFIAIQQVVPWWLTRQNGPLAVGLGAQLANILAPLAWLLLGLCWAAALASCLGSRRRRRLLDTRDSLDSLAAGSWAQFEQLVGEAFRRHGYTVEETGLGGPDGGIDLILRKQGQKVLVQCKQWRSRQIGVSVVREMAGLLAHHCADAVKIVCIGTFTRDAEAFAAGKPIELISGEALLGMIRAVQKPAANRVEPQLEPARCPIPKAAACRKCGSPLVQRTNRRTGEQFHGCSQFPRCRGPA